MAAVTAAIGVGLAAVGAGTQVFGAMSSQKAQEGVIASQRATEEARHKAMKIDADRRRRQLIRQAIIAKSQALTTGTAQGAAQSSALQGAYGQIAGTAAFGLHGVNVQEQLGEELFAANKDMLAARRAGASADTISAAGKGLSSLGGALVNNYERIDRVFGGSSGELPNVGNDYGRYP